MFALDLLAKIQSDHENIKSDEPQRFPEAAVAGDYFRQGDIYVIKRDSVPASCFAVVVAAQLTPGTTKGSRHILDSHQGVEMFRVAGGDALQGPVFKTTCERIITHPEHGDVILPPGIYEITYQRAFADELRRVQD